MPFRGRPYDEALADLDEMERNKDPLHRYTINEIQLYGGGPHDVANVVLQRRRQLDESDKWAVVDNGAVLDKDGDWVIEPLPSSRDDEYLESTRFSTPQEAITFWNRLNKPTRFWNYQPKLKD